MNTKFVLPDEAQPFELELVEVTKPTVTPNQMFYSLFFLDGGDFMLPQGTYRLNHDKLGEMMIFLASTARETE